MKRGMEQKEASSRKRDRDRRVAALSLDLIPPENQRAVRALSQVALAKELREAIILCAKSGLLMPLAALLRSLIDTSVLAIWLIKYASDEEVSGSVAHLPTVAIVSNLFDREDQYMFTFLFEPIKNTGHEFYRDVLHPSTHGDALHSTMRVRDQSSGLVWCYKCLYHATHVYVHMLLQLAKSGKIPKVHQDYIQKESAKGIRFISTLLEHPDWKGTDEHLSE